MSVKAEGSNSVTLGRVTTCRVTHGEGEGEVIHGDCQGVVECGQVQGRGMWSMQSDEIILRGCAVD